MRIPRFYLPLPLETGNTVTLKDNAFRHAIQVLRLRSESPVVLFNGQGGEFQATLQQVERRRASVRIEAFIDRETESPLDITLIQAISKGERMDYTLQKAVELGVHHIIPVFSEHSVVNLSAERLQKRRQHWQGVIIGACEQCGRNRLPTLSEPVALKTWLNSHDKSSLNLLLNPTAESSFKSLLRTTDKPIDLLIGPEGGLSPDEITLAEQTGFTGIRLGPRILRTETAGVVALTALQMLWGDFE